MGGAEVTGQVRFRVGFEGHAAEAACLANVSKLLIQI